METSGGIHSPQRVQLLQPQTVVPDEHLAFARAFIAICPFTYAKTVPANPHEYCLREWVPQEHQDDYDHFLDLIAYHGYNGRFLRQRYRYINVDGRRYWESPKIDRTGMILNRASSEEGADRVVQCCKLGEATGSKHHAKTCVNYGS
jgi:hypothetical protein